MHLVPFIAVSVAFKFHEKGYIMTEADGVWQRYLLKYSPEVKLNRDSIQELEVGLKFGGVLKLPLELKFNSSRMIDFLFGSNVSQSIIRPMSCVE